MKTMNKEIWKAVKGYEGIYEVSNLGRVKSLKRIVERIDSRKRTVNERILKHTMNKDGYFYLTLSNRGVSKTKKIHQLVTESFLNHNPCGYKLVVNHINFDKTDNRVENLEIVTQRQNTNRKHLKSRSVYIGVTWYKTYKKWHARIRIDGKNKHLGYFTDEYKAHLAYQSALTQLSNPTQQQTSLCL
jgi:hypothetical protein